MLWKLLWCISHHPHPTPVPPSPNSPASGVSSSPQCLNAPSQAPGEDLTAGLPSPDVLTMLSGTNLFSSSLVPFASVQDLPGRV